MPSLLFPYWLWLPLYGAVVLTAGTAILRVVGEREFLFSEAVLTVGAGAQAALLVRLSHGFQAWLGSDVEEERPSALALPRLRRRPRDPHGSEGLDPLLAPWVFRVFGGTDRLLLTTIVLLTEVLALLSVLVSGLPFREGWVNFIALAVATIPIGVGGHSAFMVVEYLRMLSAMGSMRTQVPFAWIPHPALAALLRYTTWMVLGAVAGYAVLAVAVWQGPYGLSPIMVAWLSALAAFPLLVSGWSVWQVHLLMRRAKVGHVAIANSLVVKALEAAQESPSPRQLESVDLALSIQGRTQHCPEWPVAPSSALALMASLLAAAAQVAVATAAWINR